MATRQATASTTLTLRTGSGEWQATIEEGITYTVTGVHAHAFPEELQPVPAGEDAAPTLKWTFTPRPTPSTPVLEREASDSMTVYPSETRSTSPPEDASEDPTTILQAQASKEGVETKATTPTGLRRALKAAGHDPEA